MKIGIISDSHDRLPTLREAVSKLTAIPVDAILHAGDLIAPFAAKCLTPEHVGDIPVHVIYGNNDGERAGLKKVLPQIIDGPLRLEMDEKVFAMHHFIEWFADADIADADVVISGHNHELSIEKKGGQLFINPGECCGWVNGRCTCVVLDTATMAAEVLELSG